MASDVLFFFEMNVSKCCILFLFAVVSLPIRSHGIQSPTAASSATAAKPKVARINVGFKYHNYNDLTSLLKSIAKKFPRYTKLFSIGKSVENRELWVMQLTEYVLLLVNFPVECIFCINICFFRNPQKEVPLKPNVKLVANMHGNGKCLQQKMFLN